MYAVRACLIKIQLSSSWTNCEDETRGKNGSGNLIRLLHHGVLPTRTLPSFIPTSTRACMHSQDRSVSTTPISNPATKTKPPALVNMAAYWVLQYMLAREQARFPFLLISSPNSTWYSQAELSMQIALTPHTKWRSVKTIQKLARLCAPALRRSIPFQHWDQTAAKTWTMTTKSRIVH